MITFVLEAVKMDKGGRDGKKGEGRRGEERERWRERE